MAVGTAVLGVVVLLDRGPVAWLEAPTGHPVRE